MEKGGARMNVVILKHTDCGRQFVFEVPATRKLKKGDRVIAMSKKGLADGVCVCDSFEVSENVVEAMRDAFGCKLPLSSIVGKYTLEMWGNSDYEP